MEKTSVDFFHRLASILSLSFFGASGLVQCLSGNAFRVPTGELARRRHPSKRARVDAEGRGGKAKSANERNCRRRRSQPPLTLALPLGLSLSFLFHFLSLSLSLSLEIRITRDSERDVLDRMERNQGEKGATAQVRRSSKKKSCGDLRSPPRRRLLSIRERSEQELLLPFFFSTYLPRALQLLDPLIGSRAYFTMVRERRKESTKGTFL